MEHPATEVCVVAASVGVELEQVTMTGSPGFSETFNL
jgi:hypothetical protein